jgi:hypothetical protein
MIPSTRPARGPASARAPVAAFRLLAGCDASTAVGRPTRARASPPLDFWPPTTPRRREDRPTPAHASPPLDFWPPATRWRGSNRPTPCSPSPAHDFWPAATPRYLRLGNGFGPFALATPPRPKSVAIPFGDLVVVETLGRDEKEARGWLVASTIPSCGRRSPARSCGSTSAAPLPSSRSCPERCQWVPSRA